MHSFLDVLPAVLACLLWAGSAQFISYGLKNLPRNRKSLPTIFVGLYGASLSGSAFTLIFFGIPNVELLTDNNVVLAGLFTYFFGTGVYYLTSFAYANNAGVASQFTNVKPLFSMLAGFLLLGEIMSNVKLVSAAIIAFGVVAILNSALRSKKLTSIVAPCLGLLLAVFWSAGEVFATFGMKNFTPSETTAGALVSSTVLFSLVFFSAAFSGTIVIRKHVKLSFLKYFVLHGFFSFFLAYYFFFVSIQKIGLSSSVIVAAFWPPLALVISLIFKRKIPPTKDKWVYVGMALFFVGSMIYLIIKVR